MRFSVYNNAYDANSTKTCTIDTVVKAIAGEKMKLRIDELRSARDAKLIEKIKLSLPAITFAGVYTYRNEAGIKDYSQIAVMDFDKLEVPKECKDFLMADPHVILAFYSPRGHGVKALIKFPGTYAEHRDRYAAALEYFKDWNPDGQCIDPVRLCFMSYDDEVYYNPNAVPFTKIRQNISIEREVVESDYSKIFDRLCKWQDKRGKTWNEGSRNEYICGLSSACNRFGIPEAEAVGMFLMNFATDKEYTPKLIGNYFRTAYTKYRGEFNTVHFSSSTTENVGVTKDGIVNEEVFEDRLIQHLIHFDDVEDEYWRIFDEGHGKGLGTGITTLDPHFTLGKGRLTLFGGIPQHGKSQFTKVLMCLQTMYHGDKWAVFGPEDFPAADFYMEITQIILGQNVQKHYGKQADRELVKKAAKFVRDHFYYVYPDNENPTPEVVFDTFLSAIHKYGVTGCLIDPYNQLENDMRTQGGREDLYIGHFASAYKRFGQQHNIYTWLIVHPNNEIKPAKGQANPDMPSQFNLAGGATWNAKCDDIVMIHRPNRESSPTDTEVWIESKKIKKQRQFGIPGRIEMKFNAVTGRYHQMTKYDFFPKMFEEKAEAVSDNPFEDIEPVTL